jgi:thioesterase domain-containing protein
LNANRALDLIKTLWRSAGIELDINIFYRRRSVQAIADAISSGQTTSPGKIIKLRDGDASRPLFLYAGGASCFLEMQNLIASLRFDGVIYGITLTDFDQKPSDPPQLSQEVAAAVAAVRQIAPKGPYRLGGYSFGGVFALELARQLISEGQEIDFLFMLDAPQNDHSWPWHHWSRLMVRTLARQIRQSCKIKSMANKPAFGRETLKHRTEKWKPVFGNIRCENKNQEHRDDSDFRHAALVLADQCPARRHHQMTFRFRNPRDPLYPTYAPQWAGDYTPLYDKAARQLLQMKGLFRPKCFDGKVLFLHSAGGSPIDCDARAIWQPYLPNAEWIKVAGNHQSMIVGRNARAVAAILDSKLSAA